MHLKRFLKAIKRIPATDDMCFFYRYGLTKERFIEICRSRTDAQSKVDRFWYNAELFSSNIKDKSFCHPIIPILDNKTLYLVSKQTLFNQNGRLYDMLLLLYSPETNNDDCLAKLYATFKYGNYSDIQARPFAFIDDIQGIPNCGYGSVLMRILIDHCYSMSITHISGCLEPEDEDHRDRQIHFYEKFNFTISNDKILLKLSKD